jgi:hypothetical protein
MSEAKLRVCRTCLSTLMLSFVDSIFRGKCRD